MIVLGYRGGTPVLDTSRYGVCTAFVSVEKRDFL